MKKKKRKRKRNEEKGTEPAPPEPGPQDNQDLRKTAQSKKLRGKKKMKD